MAFGGSSDQSLALVIKAKNRASPVLRTVARDMDNVSTRGAMMGKGLLSAGKVAAVGIGLAGVAIGAFSVASIAAFAKFEDKMNQSLAIMGDVAPAMRAEMEETARVIAKTTRFSASQAAESYFFLASAGLDAQQSIAALPQVAAFATAGMFDMARATDLATDAQSALGLTSKDAAANLLGMKRVTDVLVKANTLANASVEQFSEALTNKAGAAIKVVGKEIEEGVAVLAAFADQGLKGAAAGTALNIVFRDLQTKAIKNKTAFKEFGLSVFDSAGEMRNVGDIIGDLEDGLEGMSDETKKATLAQLGFSDKSVIFIQTLLGTSDKIKNYEENLLSAGDITQEVADKQMESLIAQFGLLKSHVTDVMIGLGEDLAPTIKDEVLPQLRNFVSILGEFAETVAPLVIGGIGLVTDALTGGIWLLQSWAEMFGLAEQGGADLTLILHEMASGDLKSADASITLSNGLWSLAKRSFLTAEAIATVTDASGANNDEIVTALERNIAWAYAIGEVTGNTRLLQDALHPLLMTQREEIWALAAAEQGLEALGIQMPQATIDANLLAEAEAAAAEATEENVATMEDMAKVLEEVDEKARDAAVAFEKELFDSMLGFVSFFKKVPKQLKLSLDEMEKNWTENFALQDRYWTGLATLAEAGFDDLVSELRKAGPEAAGQVEKLAADLEKAAEFEGMIEEGKASMSELSGEITNTLGIEKEAWAIAFFEAGQAMAIGLNAALTGGDMIAMLREAGISLAAAVNAGLISRPLAAMAFGGPGGTEANRPFKPTTNYRPNSAYEGLAGGGRFHAGQAIVVGERGPEIMMPAVGGRVISNEDSFGATSTGGSGGSGVTVENLNVNVTDDLRDPGAGRRFIEMIVREVDKYRSERTTI